MDWGIQADKKVNALILTAHPDDETIFCGGTMLYYPSWNWTVMCVTMQTGTTRLDEFNNAIAMYRERGVGIASSLTLDQRDDGQELNGTDEDVWRLLISGKIQEQPDVVFTHNSEGEYGHNHHKSLNKISHKLFGNVWEFICPGAVNVAPQPFKKKNNVVPLNQNILRNKLDIYNRCYTTQLTNWVRLPEIMQYEFRTGPEIFTN